jgi:NhaP-type Na+/H+ or K+/H+ antiporter
MSEVSSGIVVAGMALLIAGHLLGRVTRIAQETWWLASGCGLGAAAIELGVFPQDLPATLAAWLRDLLLPVVVFAGAYTVDRRCVRYHLTPVVALPLTGILVAYALFACAFATFEIDALPWLTAALLGTILAATEATPVTAQLKLRAPRGIRLLLDGEALFAAAFAFTLTDVLTDTLLDASRDPVSTWGIAKTFAVEFAIGAALGAALGWLGSAFVRRVRSDALLYWVVCAAAIAAHAGAVALGGSSLAACLLAGLTLARLPTGAVAAPFLSPLGQAARGAILVLAGVWAAGAPLAAAVPWAAAALVLMHVARFASVYGVTRAVHRLAKFEITRREQALIAVFSTRGVTTLALALLLPDTLPHADLIRTTALIVVALDLIVTTPATAWLARRFANHAPIPRLYIDRKVDVSY